MGKKGFTIVELVIVIAIIAILATVLIPTFSTAVDRATTTAALEDAKNAVQIVASECGGDFEGDYFYVCSGKYVFRVTPQGEMQATPVKVCDDAEKAAKFVIDERAIDDPEDKQIVFYYTEDSKWLDLLTDDQKENHGKVNEDLTPKLLAARVEKAKAELDDKK